MFIGIYLINLEKFCGSSVMEWGFLVCANGAKKIALFSFACFIKKGDDQL